MTWHLWIRHGRVTGLFRILAALAAVSLEGLAHADVDALLGTSGRSDLVGPEVWTCTFTGWSAEHEGPDFPHLRKADGETPRLRMLTEAWRCADRR